MKENYIEFKITLRPKIKLFSLENRKENCLLEVTVALRQLNPIYKKGSIKFFLSFVEQVTNSSTFQRKFIPVAGMISTELVNTGRGSNVALSS